MRIRFGAITILAVHDLDFSGCIVNPHSASRNAMDCITSFALLLSTAVNYRIIGIAGKRTLRIVSLHPSIERIMHEQVHQDR